jgi:hypothetical protein
VSGQHKPRGTRQCRRCGTKPRAEFPESIRIHFCLQCVAERMPTQPLVAAIERVQRRSSIDPWGHRRDAVKEQACERAEIGTRLFDHWRDGGHPDVDFDTADRVLVNLGLLWFDVFDEDTVRAPILRVTTYRARVKRVSGRGRVHYCRHREVVRTRWYGDAGPDYGELERIRRAFEGDPLEAVA